MTNGSEFLEDWHDVYNNNDGCSSWFVKHIAKRIINRNYGCSVCMQHDFDYRHGWKYGISRKEADKELRDGVIASGHPKIATVMYRSVRVVGWLFYKKR